MPTALRRDEAVSPAVAAVLFVALCAILSGSLYAWTNRAADGEHVATRNLALQDLGATQAVSTGQMKSWTVASATAGAWYGDFRVHLDGARVPCSATLGLVDSWRAWAEGGVLPCDDAGLAPHRQLRAGDQIDLWDAGAGLEGADALRGKRLVVTDAVANVVVVNAPIS